MPRTHHTDDTTDDQTTIPGDPQNIRHNTSKAQPHRRGAIRRPISSLNPRKLDKEAETTARRDQMDKVTRSRQMLEATTLMQQLSAEYAIVGAYFAGTTFTYDFKADPDKFPGGEIISTALRADASSKVGQHGVGTLQSASTDKSAVMASNKLEQLIDMVFDLKRDAIIAESTNKIQTILRTKQDLITENGTLISRINLTGFSRGGVEVFGVTTELHADRSMLGQKQINIFVIDPVPGDMSPAKEQAHLPTCLGERIILIAMQENTQGFSPLIPDGKDVILLPVCGHHETLAGSVEGDVNDVAQYAISFVQSLLNFKQHQWRNDARSYDDKRYILKTYLTMLEHDQKGEYAPLKTVKTGGVPLSNLGESRPVWEGTEKTRTLKDIPELTHMEGKLSLIKTLGLESLEAYHETHDADFLEAFSREVFSQLLHDYGLKHLYSDEYQDIEALNLKLSDEKIEKILRQLLPSIEAKLRQYLLPAASTKDIRTMQLNFATAHQKSDDVFRHGTKDSALVYEKMLLMEELGIFVKDQDMNVTLETAKELKTLRYKLMEKLFSNVVKMSITFEENKLRTDAQNFYLDRMGHFLNEPMNFKNASLFFTGDNPATMQAKYDPRSDTLIGIEPSNQERVSKNWLQKNHPEILADPNKLTHLIKLIDHIMQCTNQDLMQEFGYQHFFQRYAEVDLDELKPWNDPYFFDREINPLIAKAVLRST